jgi:hypothetical protein
MVKLATVARLTSRFIWTHLVAPNYEDSFLPSALFDALYTLSGSLEIYADNHST